MYMRRNPCANTNVQGNSERRSLCENRGFLRGGSSTARHGWSRGIYNHLQPSALPAFRGWLSSSVFRLSLSLSFSSSLPLSSFGVVPSPLKLSDFDKVSGVLQAPRCLRFHADLVCVASSRRYTPSSSPSGLVLFHQDSRDAGYFLPLWTTRDPDCALFLFFTRVTISGEKNVYLRNMRSFVLMICILFYSNVANRTFLFIVILSICIIRSF